MNNPEWLKSAKVGDKVVCIGEPVNPKLPENVKYPKKGQIVKIRSIEELDRGQGLGLTFYGYPAQKLEYGTVFHEPSLFKPLQSRPTDISIFTEMLKPLSNKISEDS